MRCPADGREPPPVGSRRSRTKTRTAEHFEIGTTNNRRRGKAAGRERTVPAPARVCDAGNHACGHDLHGVNAQHACENARPGAANVLGSKPHRRDGAQWPASFRPIARTSRQQPCSDEAENHSYPARPTSKTQILRGESDLAEDSRSPTPGDSEMFAEVSDFDVSRDRAQLRSVNFPGSGRPEATSRLRGYGGSPMPSFSRDDSW